ncbi:MAG: MBOAT family protein [Atopobiaceae bacterium]|nr:MBOAT family protein [Atopobiaceae bacterium]
MTSYFTLIFILIFLPLVLLAYTVVPQRVRAYVLLLASYAFAWIISGPLVGFMLVTTVCVYALGLGIKRIFAQRDEELAKVKKGKRAIKASYAQRARRLLVAGIVANFGILIALNYLGFFSELASPLLGLFGWQTPVSVPSIGAPIGISFYTMMAVSYLVDVYRETTPADGNFGRLALFLSFFPHIMEGPIARYSQTAESLWKGRPIDGKALYRGMLRMAIGFAKKLLVADRLNLYVKTVFGSYESYDGGIIALGAVLYTIQLYCDFSGCMDVSIGLGQLFGVDYPENFRQPFFSKTASEFWQRWHITLGAWFKDYVYYPVSLSKPVKRLTTIARKRFGNRYGPLLVSGIALFCVWLGNGLWHGAGSQYLFFGLYYFVVIWLGGFVEPSARAWASEHGIDRDAGWYRVLRGVRTLLVIFVGELFFRANSLGDGIAMFSRILTGFSLRSFADGTVFACMSRADFAASLLFIPLVFLYDLAYERGHDLRSLIEQKGFVVRWAIWIAIVMTVVIFGAYGIGYIPVDPMYAQY